MWEKLKQFCWQWRGVIIVTPSVTGAILLLRFFRLLQPLELAALDQLFLLRPLEPQDPRIVVVAIDETDIRKTRQWPISDALLAQLLNKIKQQQPRAIGLDLYRDLPVEPGHQDLVKVFESTPNLIGIQKVVNSVGGRAINPPPVLEKLGQIAANDFVVDRDGHVRRSLLSLIDQQDQTIPTLGSLLGLLYLEAEGIELQMGEQQAGQMKLGKTTLSSLQPNDGGYEQADTGGYQIIANFHSLRQGFPTVSMLDVLEGRVPSRLFRDRLVFIGVSAESIGDFFYTPYSSGTDLKTENRWPGVVIHADVASQLIAAALEGRSSIQTWAEWQEWLWILGWSFVGAVLSWTQRYRRKNQTAIPQFLSQLPLVPMSIALAGGVLVICSYIAFLPGIWVPVVPSLIALIGSTIAITGYTARNASEIRQIFGRYLTDEVVANLLEKPGSLRLGGERRQVTTLMSDLRGFSAISEQMAPEQVVPMLNDYLEVMTEVIDRYNGTINEFIGDAIMVMFGVPILGKDDAQRAVACAIAMQLAMEQVNERNRQKGLPLLNMGIGINTGSVLVGNIGSMKRAKYTIVGSPVNLTSRIESLTIGGQVLISKDTLEEAGSILQINGETQFQPKGIPKPITIYQVKGIGGKFNLLLPDMSESLTLLVQEIPLLYAVLQGKQASNQSLQGSLTKLGVDKAELRSQEPLQVFTDLKLNLLIDGEKARELGDLYAKVTETINEHTCRVHFTSVPPEIGAILEQLRTLP